MSHTIYFRFHWTKSLWFSTDLGLRVQNYDTDPLVLRDHRFITDYELLTLASDVKVLGVCQERIAAGLAHRR